ncbi:hypothetical protein [Pseudomonas sp. RIT623]|uniref:hypothetical protein n=1 Tax=Pseudomonas sp. RIT623 TaxID=2559075 RepID=UPI00106F4DEC|nr:hypothetical protein [Pseudomonas sp. RIT623]TFF39392.1 hypothetical protein E3U47_14555 [Pseudomonas sp. RIT623]
MTTLSPRTLFFGLFALVAAGSAAAAPLTFVQEPAATTRAASPWPDLAEMTAQPATTLLAHDDRYRHDERWHDRRDDWRREQWRREQWRREQHRRELERQRYWERHHERAMHHRYQQDYRYYRR